MFKSKLALAAITAVAMTGCGHSHYHNVHNTVTTVPQTVTGSREAGVLEMEYRYRTDVVMNVDYQTAQSVAERRCYSWGFSGAEQFDLTDKQCVRTGSNGVCSEYDVTVRYQCVHNVNDRRDYRIGNRYQLNAEKMASERNCRGTVHLVSQNQLSEDWRVSCGGGASLLMRCFDDGCFLK